jgi:hypothetical protein
VKDKEGLPLANVVFTIFERGTFNEVKKVVTDADGKYKATEIPVGDYDFKWSLKGYKTKREDNVHIAAGKELRRTIVLRPVGGTVVKEADVAAGTIANINVKKIGADSETSIKVEVTGSKLWFYVSDTIDGEPGEEYIEFESGDVKEEKLLQFAAELGFDDSDDEQFLNVKCVGTTTAHYKLTIKGTVS